MTNRPRAARRLAVTLILASPLVFACTSLAFGSDHNDIDPAPIRALQETVTRDGARHTFLRRNPGTEVAELSPGLISRVYGQSFAGGETPEAAADAARIAIAGMLGAREQELVATGISEFGPHVVAMMHDPDSGVPKFFAYAYRQERAGVPVFGSRVVILVRNETGFPVVLASTSARDLGDLEVKLDAQGAQVPGPARARVAAEHVAATSFEAAENVIFAGVEGNETAPVLAVSFVATAGDRSQPLTYARTRYVVDARSGAELHRESMIHDVDVTGTVRGMATQGIGPDACEPEALTPMPYARVSIGGTVAYTDQFGGFMIPNAGTSPVTVESTVRGRWFRVFNQGSGGDGLLSQSVTPPGPVNFVHNDGNSSETRRAEVNAYIESNKVRDWVLAVNPTYPVVGSQSEFTVNVMLNDTCNAFYDGDSINFYAAGGGCPNTAFGSVVYHEYGHHLVNVGGSGQGAYGEGMSDVVAMLIDDDPGLGYGFQGNCNTPLRDADNTCQYQTSGCSSCGSAIHSCGQLISGCVWDLREELGGPTGLALTSRLALNAIMLHSGTSITPSITIDYLTLDDNDGNILNGTPHYPEIATAFGLHNMDAPELAQLDFLFPNGLPDSVSPSGGDALRVVVAPIAGQPQAGSGELLVDLGSGFQAIAMAPTGTPNEYDAIFPASDCGTLVAYRVRADTTGGQTVTYPPDNGVLSVLSGFGTTQVFDDDFESNLGWTVQNTGGLTDGSWTRGVPVGGGDRGDPPTDADGSGQCFLTDNVDGNSDVDGGTTTLVSPVLNASGSGAIVSYWRWYSNVEGGAPEADVFVVDVSDDGGATWTNLETVGPSGPEVQGGWFRKSFSLGDIPGFEPNAQFRIRFAASDLGSGSVVEAGVDGVTIDLVECDPGLDPHDLDGDGQIGFGDLILLLSSWGDCDGPCPADFDGSGAVDFSDLLELLASWSN